MTSGYMWNQIRHPPYVQAGQGGQVTYIAGGYSNQLGAETHIISAICTLRSIVYCASTPLPSSRRRATPPRSCTYSLADLSRFNRRRSRLRSVYARAHDPETRGPDASAPRCLRLDGHLGRHARGPHERVQNQAGRLPLQLPLNLKFKRTIRTSANLVDFPGDTDSGRARLSSD